MPYSGDPSSSPVDEVRFWLQDTASTPLLSDAEITYVIAKMRPTTNDEPMLNAAACCTMVMAKYASEVSISQDGVTYSGEQLQDKYRALRVDLHDLYRELSRGGAAPYAGGVDCFEQWPAGARRTSFGIGMLDNPMAGDESFQGRSGGDDWGDDPSGITP